MSLDRTITPPFQEIESVDLIQPKSLPLNNGIPYFELNAGTNEVLRIDFIFRAGSVYQAKMLQASFTNSMLGEGSSNMTANEIAEGLDYYGAYFQLSNDRDYGTVTFYTLTKHFKSIIPFIKEVFQPVFPEKEFETQLMQAKQAFLVRSEEVSTLAGRAFRQSIFGKEHPYGRIAELENFDEISKNDLIDFHNEFYALSNCTIVVAGKVSEEVRTTINEHFGSGTASQPVASPEITLKAAKPERIWVDKQDALQSAIQIGKPLFNAQHEDYVDFQVLNMLLGGYFGSRLMKVIREEKGYTYGIRSSVVGLKEAGYFKISTEVGGEVTQPALEDIYTEIKKLQCEKVSEEELTVVKNFMQGIFLRNADGPFNQVNLFKNIHFNNLPENYYTTYLQKIKFITPEKIIILANKYMEIKSLHEITSGKN